MASSPQDPQLPHSNSKTLDDDEVNTVTTVEVAKPHSKPKDIQIKKRKQNVKVDVEDAQAVYHQKFTLKGFLSGHKRSKMNRGLNQSLDAATLGSQVRSSRVTIQLSPSMSQIQGRDRMNIHELFTSMELSQHPLLSPQAGKLPMSPETKFSLLRAQQARQSIERDELHLANRIRMLQLEEARILSKIELTRRQADKITDVQMGIEQTHRLKLDARRREQKVLSQNREYIDKVKHDHKHYVEAILNQQMHYKKHMYNTRKVEQIESDLVKKDNIASFIQQNQDRAAQIRHQEAKAKEKLSSVWQSRLDNSQLNYIEKLQREKERMEQKARSITTMEVAETQMVHKMQHTIDRQKQAASMLKSTLERTAEMRAKQQQQMEVMRNGKQ